MNNIKNLASSAQSESVRQQMDSLYQILYSAAEGWNNAINQAKSLVQQEANQQVAAPQEKQPGGIVPSNVDISKLTPEDQNLIMKLIKGYGSTPTANLDDIRRQLQQQQPLQMAG